MDNTNVYSPCSLPDVFYLHYVVKSTNARSPIVLILITRNLPGISGAVGAVAL